MADTKISALTSAVSLTGADVLPIVNGGATKKTTKTLLLDNITGSVVGTTDTQTLTNKDLSASTNIFPLGACVQAVSVNATAAATGTTVLPVDNTIPQNTEGDQYMTAAITPKSTTNNLIIEATLVLSSSIATSIAAALFQDATVGALAAVTQYQATGTGTVVLKLAHSMAAGTVSATTFKIRAGGNGAGTTTFNGASGAGYFGGITVSNLTIREFRA